MSEYLDYSLYEQLYARYLNDDKMKKMVGLAGDMTGKRVIDLCCGGGRLTRYVSSLNVESITAVDASEEMIRYLWEKDNVKLMNCSVGHVLKKFKSCSEFFDVAFCQQSINYWFNPIDIKNLSDVMRPGGQFIFNTFWREPSPIPVSTAYEYKGYKFVEISWLCGDVVYHVQVREGMEPHVTSFAYIKPDKFKEVLEPYFNVTELRVGSASIYHCIKK
jgi:SAM-dependent methyltransferase